LALFDAGVLRYHMQPLDLRILTETVCASNRQRFQDAGLRLTTHLPQNAPCFGDYGRLSQLCHNLLENSLRYTQAGGQLQVTLSLLPGGWQLSFSDSAPGIDPQQQPHIFDRFYRGEHSRNRASGGAGLGLAICRAITDAHQGSIRCQSSPLGGVTINVLLPLTLRESQDE